MRTDPMSVSPSMPESRSLSPRRSPRETRPTTIESLLNRVLSKMTASLSPIPPHLSAVRVRAEGRPAPKGSRIQGRTKAGRSYTRPASKYEKPWVDAVKHATELAMRHSLQIAPPYAVHLDLLIATSKRPKHRWPSQNDVDKLARSTVDGLVLGGAIDDDRNVIELHASKRFASEAEPPGVIAIVASVPA